MEKQEVIMKKILLLPVILAFILSCGSTGGGENSNGTEAPTPINPSIPYNKNDPHTVKEAHNEKYDGTNVRIGVVDSTFDIYSTEFHDDTGKSRLSRVTDYEESENIHGSLVSEIIGGRRIGIAPNVRIYGASAGIVCSNGEDRCIKTNLTMYTKLYDEGVRVYNQSFGTESLSITNASKSHFSLLNSLNSFYEKKSTTDSLFIWATGNQRSKQPQLEAGIPYLYPQMEKGWLAVTAVDSETGVISDYANRCGVAKNWCISAVGDYTFNVRNVIGSGTSFSAPVITGTAALVSQKYPWMNGDLLRQTILSTASDMGAEGVDEVYGWGLVNISKAVKGPALFDTSLALGKYVYVDFDEVTSVFENDISGNAGITKEGSGILILSGQNTYTGESIINNGELKVTGEISSRVNINNNGTFSIDGGKVSNDVVNEGGNFKNTGSGGIITGNYKADSNSVFENEIGAELKIEGSALLGGSKLKITASESEENNYGYISDTGSVGRIITANSGVFENFGEIESPELIHTEIEYKDRHVELSVKRKDVSEYAATQYESDKTRINSAKNLEQIFRILDNSHVNGDIKTEAGIMQKMNAKELSAALDSISGQIYASSQALTFQQSQAVNRELANRMNKLGKNNDKTGFWFSTTGAVGRLYESGYAKADTYLYGIQTGIDKYITDNAVLGASAAFSEAKADFDRYAGKSESQNIGLSLYGKYNFKNDKFYIMGRAGVSYIASDVEREILLKENSKKVEVSHDDYGLSLYSEAGYRFDVTKNFNVTPFLGVQYDRLKRGDFSEDESLFGLKAESKVYNQTSAVAGIRTEGNFKWAAGESTLSGHVTVKESFGEEDLDFEASYTGMSDEKFTVKGIGLSDTTVWTGVGINTDTGSGWSWYASYDMQLERDEISNNIFSVGVKINLE
jgi:autotransporter-associated beta strand protein